MKRKLMTQSGGDGIIEEEEAHPQQKVKKKGPNNGIEEVTFLDRLRGSGALDALKDLATADQADEGTNSIELFLREGKTFLSTHYLMQVFFHRFLLNSWGSKLKIFSKLNNFLLNSSKFPS